MEGHGERQATCEHPEGEGGRGGANDGVAEAAGDGVRQALHGRLPRLRGGHQPPDARQRAARARARRPHCDGGLKEHRPRRYLHTPMQPLLSTWAPRRIN